MLINYTPENRTSQTRSGMRLPGVIRRRTLPRIGVQIPFPRCRACPEQHLARRENSSWREEAMKRIEETLRRYSGRVAITAVHGMRGIGTLRRNSVGQRSTPIYTRSICAPDSFVYPNVLLP